MDEVKIYKITNQITKKVYIGQTTKENIEERLSEHSGSSDCPKLHNAIKLYGKENFKIELLDTCSKEQVTSLLLFNLPACINLLAAKLRLLKRT